MATLRELKKRLNGVKTTGQLAGAMKTVSTAKFARINSVLSQYCPYAEECNELLGDIGIQAPDSRGGKKALVLISGNRGLCGGYNSDLFAYFAEIIAEEENVLVIPCGKMAVEYCREKGIEVYKELHINDVPDFSEAAEMAGFLRGIYVDGTASEVDFICQKFINMLKHEPETIRFLPTSSEDNCVEEEMIFVPDVETVREGLYGLCTDSEVYSVLLGCCAGAQAATLMAMRSAYDNANESALMLETELNRKRQSEVTASVIETASDNFTDF